VKILVLGGGVIGVTTAYYLAREGCEVTVVEQQDGVGREASGSNAGILAAGHAFAWASPRAPMMLLRSLLGQQTAIRVRLRPDPRLYAWGLKFLRECTADRARRNTLVKLRLSQYSLKVMADLVRREGIDYHAIERGALYLFRDPGELDLGAKKMRLMAEHGQRQEVLDPDAVANLDPVFAPVKHKIAGGMLDLGDSSGDSRLFTEELARVCHEKLGLTFQTGVRVRAMRADGNRIAGVLTDRGVETADVYVLALGVHSPIIARTAGVNLPIYPAKGYSSTFPLRPGALAPTIPCVDEKWLVAWSRMGDRLRLTSTAEFTGYDWSWGPRNFANIRQLAGDLFPDAVDFDRGEYRACLRPVTPAGPPILGAGRHENLFFNTGHGHLGWTMACGSSRVVADLILGRVPEIDLEGLAPRA
jgi:D-amino-acid dehydrogenase